jgi:glycosyltransferase involved in cell wall biosynthesis
MRVLHILNDVTDRGNGIVNTTVDLAIEEARQGLVVALASAGGGFKPLLERAGVLHLTLDQSRRPLQLLRASLQFRKYVRDFRPDVVHAHMRTGLMIARVMRPFCRYALVGHVHNVHDRESLVMGLADRVIAVSQSVATTMTASGISRKKIRVVLNRTLGNKRQPSLEEVVPARLSHPAIVAVGGMNSRKGIEELINAFDQVGKDFAGAHLYLVGDGAEREKFQHQAHNSKWRERIHFEGFQAIPQAYMLSADVFVLASRRESFGLVLTEAREAGCAIVATDVDGVAEALDGGCAGMLIPARDVSALSGALSQMLNNEEERTAWRHRAQQGIANYQVREMAHEVRSIYDEVIGRPALHVASDIA